MLTVKLLYGPLVHALSLSSVHHGIPGPVLTGSYVCHGAQAEKGNEAQQKEALGDAEEESGEAEPSRGGPDSRVPVASRNFWELRGSMCKEGTDVEYCLEKGKAGCSQVLESWQGALTGETNISLVLQARFRNSDLSLSA